MIVISQSGKTDTSLLRPSFNLVYQTGTIVPMWSYILWDLDLSQVKRQAIIVDQQTNHDCKQYIETREYVLHAVDVIVKFFLLIVFLIVFVYRYLTLIHGYRSFCLPLDHRDTNLKADFTLEFFGNCKYQTYLV